MTEYSTAPFDPILQEFVAAPDDIEARQEMDKVLDELTPFIRKSVKIQLYKRGLLSANSQNVDDVVSEIWLRIIPKLIAMRKSPETNALYNLRSYAFKLVRNYCYDYGLSIERERRCITELRADYNVSRLKAIAEKSCRMEKTAEMRVTIENVWAEILLLNVQQRIVIILDIFRENEYVVLAALGITSLKSIAAATGLPEEVIANYYNNSPCDSEIAELLNCSKQRVVNLRSSARKRLMRRSIIAN
jgi:DNA-directed RNA polymerase specialized sigma24 family protein